MYGLIGSITAAAGKRDELARLIMEGMNAMPGCLSYIIAKDPQVPDKLWVTEVWESREQHEASLKLPAVQSAIQKGRPLMSAFGDRVETVPIGGHGLVRDVV
jgi:quinol monooxygenase YgiN